MQLQPFIPSKNARQYALAEQEEDLFSKATFFQLYGADLRSSTRGAVVLNPHSK